MVGPLLLTTLLTTPAQAEVVRRALLVGANDGGLDLPSLRYTQNDVERMSTVLIELGGFEPEDVIVL
ncbi:MAG: caspase family protein, partial [Proteobacteria bacterium]|nr:caspase family protein [Pseudomonadota bacterium]